MNENIKQKLEQKEKELHTLHKVAQFLSGDLELEEIFHKIVDIAEDITQADSCFIYLYDREKDELVLSASRNPHNNEIGSIKLKKGEGLAGWAAERKKPISISSGAYKDKRFMSFASLPEDNYEAFLSVPILHKDEVIGVINIQHKQNNEYHDDQVQLIFIVAQYLGSAVQSALSHRKVRIKTEQLDVLSKISNTITSDSYLKEILQLIVTMTAEMMNSKISSIMLHDDKKKELVIAATQSLSDDYRNKAPLKIGESVSGKAVREKKPISIPDVTKEPSYMYPDIAKKEGIVSMLSVPMMIKEKVVGVINSYKDHLHEFSTEEISILQSVANQAAVSIENTRLNEEIFKAREDLEIRKIVDRAKGILMKTLGINEDEAYKKIQKKSMHMRKSMRELAEAIILADDMQGLDK